MTQTPDLPAHLCILVVDDNEEVRNAIVRLLQAEGHSVASAAHPAEALALFQPSKFHLVMTDFSMPDMTGEALAARLKAISPNQLVIVVTTLVARPASRPSPGIDYLLPKPFKVEDFRQAIAALTNPGTSPGPPGA